MSSEGGAESSVSTARRRSLTGALGPDRSAGARMVSKNIRPTPKIAAPAIPRVTQVLSVVDRVAGAATFGCRRFGPFHALTGTHRVTNANASEAHTGQACCSCSSSQSRHTRAFRSCMHDQFTTRGWRVSGMACQNLSDAPGPAGTNDGFQCEVARRSGSLPPNRATVVTSRSASIGFARCD